MAVEKGRLAQGYGLVTDTHGRRIITDLIPSDYSPNPLRGREGHISNKTAYKEARENFGDMHSLIQHIRAGFPQDNLNLKQLLDLTSLMSVLPIYMALRRENPIEEHSLPPATIDLARTAAGIVIPLIGIRDAGVPTDEHLTSSQIYRFANGSNNERYNYFLADRGEESCPAPEAVVKSVLDTIIKRPDDESITSADTQWREFFNATELNNALKFGVFYKVMTLYQDALRKTPQGNFMRTFELTTRLDQLYFEINRALGYDDIPEAGQELMSFFQNLAQAAESQNLHRKS